MGMLIPVVAALAVNFAEDIGTIRPELHSSGFGPTICSQSAQDLADLKSMGFCRARTHDWSLINPNQRVCDYHHIFPLMSLDATKPEHYFFAPTDYLLRRTREEAGLGVLFRLGTSIEHSGPKVHFNSTIPDDFKKVAEIFAGTVRHYNRGWANGHEWGIKYWEIWNEPDNMNCMWCLPDGDSGVGATAAERAADLAARNERRRELFVRFFVTCLKRLKGEFGDSIRVGGPALCTWRDDDPASRKQVANGPMGAWNNGSVRRTGDYFRKILSACRDAGVAPDFISWHYYGCKIEDVLASVEKGRRICDEMGFPGCELILDEWHWRKCSWGQLFSSDPAERRRMRMGPDAFNGINSACFTLALIARLQTSRLDQSYFYGCRHTGDFGFKDESGEKFKVFHALKLFGDIVRRYSTICASSCEGAVTTFGVRDAAGRKALLVVDCGGSTRRITVEAKGVAAGAAARCTILDDGHDLVPCDVEFSGGVLSLVKSDDNSAAFFVEFDDAE